MHSCCRGAAFARPLVVLGAPSVIVENVSRDEGERLERRLERAGATVELD
jgi:ribosomal protein L7/L12